MQNQAAYDEMYTPDGQVRPPYGVYADCLIRQPSDALVAIGAWDEAVERGVLRR